MRSVEDEPRFVVGMDAHAHKLAVSIWDWSDRFNACLHREIKCVDVERFPEASKLGKWGWSMINRGKPRAIWQ